MPIIDRYIPSTDFGSGFPDLGAVRLFSYLLFLVFIIHCSIAKKVKILNNWVGILIFFYGFVLVSISWSNYSYGTGTLQSLFNTAFLPVFFVVVALNIFQTKEKIEKYIISICIASAILSLTSIGQMALGASVISGEARSTGTFGNPNGLAIFLVLTIPCILYAIEKKLISRLFSWVFPILTAGGILFTVSKKGIATMVICFCLYNFLKKKYKNAILTITIFGLLAIALSGYTIFTQRFESTEVKTSFENKWDMTVAGWEMFKTSPIIGLGYRGYYENYGNYFPLSGRQKYDAHNIFITALANYGLLGFIFFIGIFLEPLLASSKILRSESSNEFLNDIAIICLSSIIPFMINGWFAGGLFRSNVIICLLFTNISLIYAVKKEK